MPSRAATALSTLFATILCGCGGSDFATAPVRGKLTCGGQPVTTGRVTFNPIAPEGGGEPGRTAVGLVQPDGTFVLATYEAGDGAIIGRHTVSWAPPEAGSEDEDEGEEGEATPAARPAPARGQAKGPCSLGGQAEVEVVAGDNDLTVDLSPRGAARVDN